MAVADHRHFGQAAAACFVSQPALSSQVRELEQRLGVPLFERRPGQVLLTEAGAVLVERARAVLGAVDDLVAAADEAGDPLAGPLALGAIPTVAPYLLPRALPAVREALPRLRLRLREDRTAALLERLRRGELDAAVLALPTGATGLVEVELLREPFVLAVPAGHPLDCPTPAAEAALAGEPLVLLEEGHCLRDQALQVCGLAAGGEAEVQGTSLSTVVQMVAGGLGITLLPASAVPVEVRPGGGVAVCRFEEPSPARTLGLVWRASSPRGAVLRRLAEVLAGPAEEAAGAAAVSG